MFRSLCGEFSTQDTGQTRRDMRAPLCWKILEAFNACKHALCRAQPGKPHPWLAVLCTWLLHSWLNCFRNMFVHFIWMLLPACRCCTFLMALWGCCKAEYDDGIECLSLEFKQHSIWVILVQCAANCLLVFSVEGIGFVLSLGTLMHGLGHFVSSYPCSEKKGQDTGSYEPAWVWGQEGCKVCNQTITVSLLQPLHHLLLPVGQLNYLKQNSAMSELNSLQHKTCFLSQDNKTPLELL
jgi:hypothetical protein